MVNGIFLPRVNTLRLREGLPPDRDVMTQTWAAERLNLIAVSPHICDLPKDRKARPDMRFFESALGHAYGRTPAGLDQFLSSGEPPVYITFGSMMLNNLEYIRETVAIWRAIRRLGAANYPVASE